ncbi:hypothetical protein [Streptomyces sp. NPDC048442]|uniref:hypothetical protein n=1 Tax=Streptomyces sp. NPDC048442 TaxID=3154823 RepID=UPI00342CD5DF
MKQAHLRRWALAAVPVTALLLVGCGIRETDVIEAGDPGRVQNFVNPDGDALLFFRLPHGELTPVPRRFRLSGAFGDEYRQPEGATRRMSTEEAISALLGGPGKAEKAAGLGTALPRITTGGIRVRTSGSAGGSGGGSVAGSAAGEVVLTLPLAVGRLDATAVRQLICTAAYSRDRDGRATVRMTGQDGVSASGTCDLDPQHDE